jgi:hypothetical protein
LEAVEQKYCLPEVTVLLKQLEVSVEVWLPLDVALVEVSHFPV